MMRRINLKDVNKIIEYYNLDIDNLVLEIYENEIELRDKKGSHWWLFVRKEK